MTLTNPTSNKAYQLSHSMSSSAAASSSRAPSGAGGPRASSSSSTPSSRGGGRGGAFRGRGGRGRGGGGRGGGSAGAPAATITTTRREEAEIKHLEARIAAEAPAAGSSDMTAADFSQLPLSRYTLTGLEHGKFRSMTQIQRIAIPHALAGCVVCVQCCVCVQRRMVECSGEVRSAGSREPLHPSLPSPPPSLPLILLPLLPPPDLEARRGEEGRMEEGVGRGVVAAATSPSPPPPP